MSVESFCLVTYLDEKSMIKKFNDLSTKKICPGKYCGYSDVNQTTCGVSFSFDSCSNYERTDFLQACPRGFRVNDEKICQLCTDSLSLYNFMYIVFMSLLALSFHAYYIHRLEKKKSREFSLVK